MGRRWSWAVGLALAGCAPARGAWTVDRVEGGRAVVLVETDEGISAIEVPAGPGLDEGAILVDGEPDPGTRQARVERIARSRARLLAGDDGRDLTLDRGPP